MERSAKRQRIDSVPITPQPSATYGEAYISSGWRYLDLQLHFSLPSDDRSVELEPLVFRHWLMNHLSRVYGQMGAAWPLDVFSYDRVRRRALVRVSEAGAQKVRAALTLVTEYQCRPCRVDVHAASISLLALLPLE